MRTEPEHDGVDDASRSRHHDPLPPGHSGETPKTRADPKRRRIPAFITGLLGGGLVIALPLVAKHFDGSADEFSRNSVPVLPALGWLICASLGAIVVTHRLQMWFSVHEGSAVAIAYDALPLMLLITPVIAVAALVSGHLLLAVAAGLLTLYHLILVLPRFVPERRSPSWVIGAPRMTLVVANVYVDNETPRDAAEQLVQSKADVIVIIEGDPAFITLFDDVGGAAAYPHRLVDPDDRSEYAMTVASRLPLGEHSRMQAVGPLNVALAEVCVEGITVTIAGMNPMATFDENGHATWKQQIDALEDFIPTIEGPLVVAGDLNMTSYRPEFKELLRLGLTDAIDSLGMALKPSFSLRSVWKLGAFGEIARLDHALTNDWVRAVEMRNMEACGSDHLPFMITLALRSDGD